MRYVLLFMLLMVVSQAAAEDANPEPSIMTYHGPVPKEPGVYVFEGRRTWGDTSQRCVFVKQPVYINRPDLLSCSEH